MLDHLALSVPQDKYQAVLDFYLSALSPLGYETIISMFDGKLVGLGSKNSLLPNKADFWLSGLAETNVDGRYAHWAFLAGDKKTVDEFHAKALTAGGNDNGAPGPRPHFGPNYYAAFITDPMGNNVEVVCRKE